MLFRLILLLCFIAANAAAAAPRLVELAVLEDAAGTETIERIAARPASDFQPLPGNSFAGGYTRSVHWLRVTIEAPEGEWWLEVLPPILDDLRLYQPDPTLVGRFAERRQGDTLPFSVREIDYRGFIFTLRLSEAGTTTLFLRMKTTSSSMLLLRLSAPQEFFGGVTLEYGLLFGSSAILLAVLLLNVNAWFWLRDPLTLWFIAYLLALTILLSGNAGLLHQYLYPGSGSANNVVVNLASLLSISFGNAFYRRLFHVDRGQPVLYWTYEGIFGASLLGVLASAAGYFTESMHLLTATVMPMTLLGCLLSVRLWRRNAPGGGMMLVANLISMAGIAAFVLFLRGHVAGGFILMHGLQIASLGTILALQLAVGTRYRALQDDRIQAERDAAREREMRQHQSQFLAMLAHELRTSLAVLKMALGLQPMSPKVIASAERAMAGMSDVIERSIQVEKLADGSVQIDPRVCNVAEMVDAIVTDSHAPSRLRLRCSADVSFITDANLLRIILVNLVDNALKYSPAGSTVDIDLACGTALTLRICNAVGPVGHPDPDKVFDKYYRAPAAHETTGSGLGLHIARALTGMLGGELKYQPAADRICFELRL